MLSEFQKELTYCTFCPKLCKFACPVAVATAREDVTPTSKMQFAYFVVKGMENLDDPDYNSIFYQCTTCTACSNYCDHQIDVSRVLLEARREVAGNGIIPEFAIEIRDNFLKSGGNPYGGKIQIKKNLQKYFVDEAQVTLFPGYTVLTEHPALLEKTFKVFNFLGIDYVSLFKGASSSGYPLYTLGFQQEFTNFASKVYREVEGYKKIITLDPADAWIFKVVYSDLGFNLSQKVLTIDEFLGENINLIKEKIPEPIMGSYTFHDPCYLGRYQGIFDLPRKILDIIFSKRIDPPFAFKDSFCCGRGGMYHMTSPQESKEVAKERKNQLLEAHADVIVTSCPGGVVQLRGVGRKVKVWHLIDALYEALGGRNGG